MKSVRHVFTRSFSSFRKTPLPTPPPGPIVLQTEPVDEEICPGYDSKRFYPAKPGEVLADRYQILVKVGWGVSSTVWLARDMRGDECESESVVALKIKNTSSGIVDEEQEIEKHIATKDSSHRGRALFRTSVESFEISGPQGSHLCLAYEAMREPIWLFQRRFRDRMIPIKALKTYILLLLTGLDYLHASCSTVHTDLKLDNIMVTFEDPTVLSNFMNSQFDQPMQHKIDSFGRPIYLCHNDFGPLTRIKSIPKLVDFGQALKLNEQDDCGIHPIQPDHYRAPEVILGCGWRMSADIWNLGVLLWDIIQGKELFRQIYDTQGHYDAKAHLAEMIALLGPPPPELIARSYSLRDFQWPEAVKREDGKICENAEQYFDGPFFDANGQFLYKDLIPDRKIEDSLPPLGENDRENFLSFVKQMLAWLPEKRKTAGELAQHPFLQRK